MKICSALIGSLLVAGAAAADAPGDAWTLGLNAKSDFEVGITLSQESPDAVPDEYGTKEVHPEIVISCSARGDGTLAMHVDWRRFISSFNTEAGFGIDDGKATWIKMGVDSSNKVTIAKSDDDVRSIVNAMRGGSELTVEVVPYSESGVSVTFDLATFTESLAKLEDSCT